MKYVYPEIFTEEQDGMYSVNFPDFESCYTSGENLAEAVEMASDVLALTLYDMEECGEAIPAPSKIHSIKTDNIVSFDCLRYYGIQKAL